MEINLLGAILAILFFLFIGIGISFIISELLINIKLFKKITSAARMPLTITIFLLLMLIFYFTKCRNNSKNDIISTTSENR
jgi:hypothetical protein